MHVHEEVYPLSVSPAKFVEGSPSEPGLVSGVSSASLSSTFALFGSLGIAS